MNFQKGANRLLVVLVVIWEALWLLPLRARKRVTLSLHVRCARMDELDPS
jgi:hypothetical protein